MKRALVCVLALITCSCGGQPAAQPTQPPAPTVAPTPEATATRAPATATATAVPKPTATPEPAASNTVWVGNTDGQGVFLRQTPVMSDRVRAYPDGTELTVIGDDVDGDGQHWKHVRTPDGLEGYIPAMYTTAEAPP